MSRLLIAPLRSGVAEWIPLTDGKTYDVLPELSPNGQYVYFQSARDGFRCIWAQRLDAGDG